MGIKRVGVVGCGTMGSGIAQLCAQSGYEVVASEINSELLNKGLALIDTFLTKGIDRGKVRSLQEGLQMLLGEDPLLAEWAEQFYEARSEIVHQGWTADLLFQHPQATRAHAPLVRSGQRILRVATEAELRQRAGGTLARELPALFYRKYVLPDLEPNEARLARLRRWGRLRGRSAREFLNLVGELRLTDSSGSLRDAAAAGRKLLVYFVETCCAGVTPHPSLRNALEVDGDPAQVVHAYREVQAALRDGSIAPWPVSDRNDLHLWRTERAVRHFAAYVQAAVPEMVAAAPQ